MSSPLQQQRCANHADRPGHAICMACRKVVCQECATRWDGINYCVDCLAERRAAAREGASVFRWVGWAAAVLGLFYATSRAMVFSAVILARMWD